MTQILENSSRPRPIVTADSKFYWDGARRENLLIQHCSACQRYVHPPGPACPTCGGTGLQPREVSGLGTVHSFCLVHHIFHPAFKDEVPYVVARVELKEQAGLILVTNIRRCPPAAVRVGLPVQVMFEAVGEDVLPQFEPVSSEGTAP